MDEKTIFSADIHGDNSINAGKVIKVCKSLVPGETYIVTNALGTNHVVCRCTETAFDKEGKPVSKIQKINATV